MNETINEIWYEDGTVERRIERFDFALNEFVLVSTTGRIPGDELRPLHDLDAHNEVALEWPTRNTL